MNFVFVFHFRRQTPGFVYYVFFKLAYIIIIIQTTSTKNIFHKIKLSTDTDEINVDPNDTITQLSKH